MKQKDGPLHLGQTDGIAAAPWSYLPGVNRAHGALVVVRPDQYIAYVLLLDAHQALVDFFSGFMLAN